MDERLKEIEKNWNKISKYSQSFGYVIGYLRIFSEAKNDKNLRNFVKKLENDIWNQIQDDSVEKIDFQK
jgi:hypothetical protein